MTRTLGPLALVILVGSVHWVQADGGCSTESLSLGLTTVTVDGEPSSAEVLDWSTTALLEVDIYGEAYLEVGPHYFDTTNAVTSESTEGSSCGGVPGCSYRYDEGTTELGFSGEEPASLTVGAGTVILAFADDSGEYEVNFEILEVIGYY